jgi:hypothetical protein
MRAPPKPKEEETVLHPVLKPAPKKAPPKDDEKVNHRDPRQLKSTKSEHHNRDE